MTAAVKFGGPYTTEFVTELKQRVDAHFRERGLSDKATPGMIARTVIILAITCGSYGLILSGRYSPWTMLALAVVMGVGMAGIGFGVAHDALHGAYSHDPRINRLLGYSFDLLGASSYLWKITHNVIHHTYTNIQSVDEDLEVSPLIRLSPHSQWRPVHRHQHWLAFGLYSLSTLFWVWVKDYKYLLQRKLGPYENKKHPPREVAVLLSCKLVYYGWSVVVPLVVLDIALWQFLVGYLALHLTAGTILGVVFQLAHVVEGPEHVVPPAEGYIDATWAVHEMRTTSNFATGNRLITWYVGGLNYQIEHHLFPRVCSAHYPAIKPIVREVAERHAVPYHEQPTLWAAIRSHYRTLKRHGDPALCPA
ncbi:MAG: acyl-CoA desaturase [Gemmatimonadetes bacterium]|nr:acyl-CoA desaturase [Gemmatimonadota bacterium]